MALVVAGLAIGLLLVEATARLGGLADPPRLGAEFDRSPALFFAEPERQHPWSRGAAETFTIAVIGDSFTVGEGVQHDDAYPARLERLLNLNAEAPPAEVRTYARSGTSTHFQLRFLRQAVAEGPQMILLGIFLNESENFRVGAWRAELEPRVPGGWRLTLLRASHAGTWLYGRLEQRRIRGAWVEYMHRIWDPDFEGYRRFERALAVFAGTASDIGVPLLALVLPPAGALGGTYPFAFVHERIHRALEGQQIPFLDLLEMLSGRSEVRLAVLPGLDGHYNEIAHRIVAEAIFGHLLREGYLPAVYGPRLATVQAEEMWLRRLRKAREILPP